MSDIEELQRRITAAMDQVAYGLERLGAAPAAGPDEETLRALEEERTVNAQLQERVRALREKHEAGQAAQEALRARVDGAQEKISSLDVELQRVRRANNQLAEACKALREANAEGVGEAHLINKAMLAELEALRAARAADVAEARVILSSLMPLLDDADTQAEETA